MRLEQDTHFTTLSWVKPELDESLKQARLALQDYVEEGGDHDQLQACAGHLHQVQGALRMVEIYGAAMVAEEMEQLATALLGQSVANRDEAYTALMRSIMQLPDYLERLQSGHKDVPMALLPLINDLRGARGEKVLQEGVLLGLGQGHLDESDLAHARGSLAGHNRDLLNTVAGSIKEDILRVKEALDLHLRASDAPVANLAPQADALSSVADTLGMLGLGVPRRIVQEQRAAIQQLAAGQRAVDEAALLDIAGSLLQVEASLDDQVARLGQQEETGAADGVIVPLRESQEALGALIKESVANFVQARQCFVAFIEAGWDHAQLNDVPRLLDEVSGAMHLLEQPRAARQLRALSVFTQLELLKLQRVPDASQMDRLADALASLEYYLEALRDHRPQRDRILELAESGLVALGYWPIPAAAEQALAEAAKPALEPAKAAPEPAKAAPEPTKAAPVDAAPVVVTPVEQAPAEIAAVETTPSATTSSATVPDSTAQGKPPAAEAAAVDAPAATVVATPESTAPVVAVAPANSGKNYGFADSAEIDDDIREVFVEELDEELGNLADLYAKWSAAPNDMEVLRPLRRVFHTLKGSGRLVGALELGEFSWKFEGMLNRVLDGSRPANDAVLAHVGLAKDVLPQFRGALLGEATVTADIEGLKEIADRIAGGEDVFYTPTATGPSAEQQEADRVAAEKAAAEKLAAEQAEAARIAAEHAEAQRVAAEHAEAQRVAAEHAEAERIAAEQAEAERVAAEQAETARIAAEQAEADRVAAEKAEAERIAAEQAEAQRIAAEHVEAERVAAEQAEAQRIAAEHAEAERVAAEQAEAERVAAEHVEAERVAAEQAEAERVAAEQAEAERVAAEQAEAERVAAERAEAERVAAEQAEAERVAAEKAEAERIAAEQVEANRVAAEQAEAERVAAEHAEAARIAAEQAQAERRAAEQAEIDLLAAAMAEELRAAHAHSAPAVEEVAAEGAEVRSEPIEPEPVEVAQPALVVDEAASDSMQPLPTALDAAPTGESGLPEGAAYAKVDPTLLEILRTEVDAHLQTIQRWLAASAEGAQPVSDALLRAVHTISGAFAMTEVPLITEALSPTEGYMRRMLVQRQVPTEAGLNLMRDIAQAVETVLLALQQPHPMVLSQAALAERAIALRDALPEPTTPALPMALDEVEEAQEAARLAAEQAPAPEPVPVVDSTAAQAEAERLEYERLEAEYAEQARLAEQQRQAAELAEAERLEYERLEAEYAQQSRRAEEERVAAEHAEAERLAGEQAAAEHAEAERAAAEQAAAEHAEAELAAAEQAAAELAEAERVAAEQAAAEHGAAEHAEAERLAAEHAEAERLAAEQAEAERVAAEHAEAERLAAEQAAAEHAEAERVAAEQAEAERLAAEQAAAEQAEAERLATEQAAAEQAAAEQAQAERLAAERAEAERIAAEQAEAERVAAEQAEAERKATEAIGAQFAQTAHDAAANAAIDASAPVADASPVASTGYAFLAQSDPDPAAPLDMADVDPDLLDIFAEETTDILDHSDGLLARLRETPTERELVVGLQRDLHTLKGGARMCGMMAVGELAHAMESVLEGAADARLELGPQGLDVLEQGFDRLHGMLARINNRQAVALPEHMIAAFNALARGVLPTAPAQAEVSAAEVPAIAPEATAAEPAIAESVPAAAEEFAAEPAAPAQADDRKPALRPLSVPVEATAFDEADDTSVRAPQEQVRIRADLLDRLVNYAGEVAIYRARLEQQLGTFRTHLDEMEQTTTRLRQQLRKLEIETEAQISARYQRAGEVEKEFDPLELDRFSTQQQLTRALSESASDMSSLHASLDEVTRQYETLLLQQSRVSSELQDGLMRTRMVPFDALVPRLRRVIRQAAAETSKQIQIKVEGAQGEMDRNVLDRMTAPLEHMLRNSAVHGLETPAERTQAGKPEEGTVTVSMRREGSEVVMHVSDDGRGLNRDAIRRKAVERGLLKPDAHITDNALFAFILESGFSTADTVSRLAGRGVGMDVVHNEIRQLGGSLQLDSVAGQGTTFTIRLPFTLAVTQAAIVKIGETSFAVPISSVQGVGRIARDELEKQQAAPNPTFMYAGEPYAIHDLGRLLGQPPAKAPNSLQMPLLLSRSGDTRAAICVDEVLGSREIVVKPVGPQVSSIPGIFGATIMGDGGVMVILDVVPLVRRAVALAEAPEEAAPEAAPEVRRVPLVMVVDDSITMRKVTGRVLERNNLEVLAAKDGVDAIEKMVEVVPDVMLLDIEMPRMDGYELATHMRNDPRLRDVPIIMITSRSGDKHRQRAFEIGVNRYLGKPYQEAELMRNVFELLTPVHQNG